MLLYIWRVLCGRGRSRREGVGKVSTIEGLDIIFNSSISRDDRWRTPQEPVPAHDLLGGAESPYPDPSDESVKFLVNR